MKYYLVALFDNDSHKNIIPLQKNLSKKFRANRNIITPNILLEVLDNPNLDRLDTVMEKITKPYKNFKVELSNKVSVCEGNKTVNVKLEDVGYIKRLNRVIHDTLKLHSFNLKTNSFYNNNITISVANLNYISRDTVLNDSLNNPSVNTLKVNRIELWKINNNKRETVVKSYPFKSF